MEERKEGTNPGAAELPDLDVVVGGQPTLVVCGGGGGEDGADEADFAEETGGRHG